MRDLIPTEVLLIHYLDDFLLIARDRDFLRGVTSRVAGRLRESNFLVSPKSTLDPVQSLFFPGKFFEAGGGGGGLQYALRFGQVGLGLVATQRLPICAQGPAVCYGLLAVGGLAAYGPGTADGRCYGVGDMGAGALRLAPSGGGGGVGPGLGPRDDAMETGGGGLGMGTRGDAPGSGFW